MTKRTTTTRNGKTLPVRTWLHHSVPQSVYLATTPTFFITITVRNRTDAPLIPIANDMLDSVRFYKNTGKWFPYLFLVMPDHLHMLVSFPETETAANVIGYWKKYIAKTYLVDWQQGYFDTRIRDDEHFFERWDYIINNPVRKGLVTESKSWQWCIAYDPNTGEERTPTGIGER